MKLPERTIALAQVGLSYLIVAGYFGIILGEGMKYLSPGTASSLKDIVMLVAAFWFMRQRSSDPPTQTEPK
jgi:hypothetical protein